MIETAESGSSKMSNRDIKEQVDTIMFEVKKKPNKLTSNISTQY